MRKGIFSFIILYALAAFPIAANAEDIVKGDVNSDGEVTLADAALLKDIVLGRETTSLSTSVTDINSDGVLTVTDVTRLIKYLKEREEGGLNVGIDGWGESDEDYGGTVKAPRPKRTITKVDDLTWEMTLSLESSKVINGFQLTLNIPDGLELVAYSSGVYGELVTRNAESHGLYNGTSVADGKLTFLSYSTNNDAFFGTSGDIMRFTVKATNGVVPDNCDITVSSVEMSDTDCKAIRPDDFVVSGAAIVDNAKAYTRLSAEIAAAQTALDEVKAKIANECPDVAANYDSQASEIQSNIDALSSDLSAKYEAIELTAESTVDLSEINNLIETMYSNAVAAQKAYEDEEARKQSNEDAYTRLSAEIAAAQTALDDAKAKIANECPDVAANYDSQASEIQSKIEALSSDLSAKHEAVELTAESTVDLSEINALIEEMYNNAVAAQKAYEDEEARKEDEEARKQANEDAYTRLSAEIAAVQTAFDEAKTKIANECPDVAANYDSQASEIQSKIDAQSSDLSAKHEAVELTAESTVDLSEINALIETMYGNAVAAQKAYEDEEARKQANEDAYTRLSAEIAAAQTALDDAKTKITNECPDVAANYDSQVSEIQSKIDVQSSDLSAKYEAIELTAESTVDLSEINNLIETMYNNAIAAQKAYEDEEARKQANEDAYTRLSAEIAAAQTTLDDAKAKIASECPDVAANYDSQASEIQSRIEALSSELSAKYEAIELTAESTVDLSEINSLIGEMYSNAVAAQKAYEDEEARKQANEDAYTRLSAEIDDVQNTLIETLKKIQSECPDVAANYDSQASEIQSKIDTETSNLVIRYEAVWLTSESTVDLSEIYSLIETMLADAIAAQESAGIDGITIDSSDKLVNVYTLGGKLMKSKVAISKAKEGIPSGLYVIDGKKAFVE